MYIMKLRPTYKDYMWGGNHLVDVMGMKSNLSSNAEAWVLSSHPDGESYIENGQFAGMSISQMLKMTGKKILGTNCANLKGFPMLIKLVDAKKPTSIKVHPTDEYAFKHENQFGNTKMWYILDSARGSYVYYGFKEKTTKQELKEHIKSNTLTDVLNKIKVKKGDCLFIKAGTIHAIGSGVLLAEIQQNSNCTYTIYDHDRVDEMGNKSELNIQKALDVACTEPSKNPIIHKSTKKRLHLANCDYFVTDRIFIEKEGFIVADKSSFVNLLIIEGNAIINGIQGKTGDSFFVPAGFGRVNITGDCTILESRV